MSKESFLSSVETNFDHVAGLLGLSDDLAEKIKIANSTYVVRFGVRLRGGLQSLTGYRTVHSEHFEPVKGGIRYAMGVNQDEVEAGVRAEAAQDADGRALVGRGRAVESGEGGVERRGHRIG